MPVLDHLTSEHRLILAGLACLESQAQRCLDGGQLELDAVQELMAFLREFVRGCHHVKEEEVLFPGLEALGFERDGGPVGMLCYEHEAFNQAFERIEKALPAAEIGDPWSLSAWARQVDAFVSMARGHISKEEDVLFPMARTRSPQTLFQSMLMDVERLEIDRYAGVRESWDAALEALCGRFGVQLPGPEKKNP